MTQYSLLDGLPKAEQIVQRIQDIDSHACSINDHGSISGAIPFIKAMKKAGKKPLVGSELYISHLDSSIKDESNRKLSHLPIIAKNKQGWQQLIKITSAGNSPDSFYYKPRLSLEELADLLNGSIMGFSGHLGSDMANVILRDDKIQPNWEKDGVKLAYWMQEIFGRENFYLEVQLMDGKHNPLMVHVAEVIREISKKTGIPCVATPDAHYAFKEQAADQRILLCNNLKVSMKEASNPDFMLSTFFRSDNYHIPSYDEMISYGHTEAELDKTVEFASKVDAYDVFHKPLLPQFQCPKPYSTDTKEYLRHLCKEGWRRLIQDRIPKEKHDEYAAEVRRELEVFEEAGLSGYFLICEDIVRFVRDEGWLPGPGRGSAAGCLVSYLIGITAIDPMPYNLLFERFYNAGRNTADHISYPDIDIDVPVEKRDEIINYIKQKYGEDRVAQIITFTTMKGGAALKNVLRAYKDVSFEEMNAITKYIPNDAEIAADLQEMQEETGESSIIGWALENRPDKFAEWCVLEDDGTLSGDLAPRFEQAIRLEGTKAAQSRHPAGVVIAPEPLNSICPLVYDTKTKTQVAGFEMADSEYIGLLKFDILGVAVLDKLMGVSNILRTGNMTI